MLNSDPVNVGKKLIVYTGLWLELECVCVCVCARVRVRMHTRSSLSQRSGM